MNRWIEKNFQKIFLLFLFLGPVLDCVTSVMLNLWNLDLTIGIIVRVLFLLFFFYFYFFVCKDRNKKKSILFLALICGYAILFLLQIIILKGEGAFFYELKNSVRIFYFPILLLLLYGTSKTVNLNVERKTLAQILLIYLFLLFIPAVTGTSFNGYTQGKVGLVGWFNSANEISAIFSLLLPTFLYELWKERKYPLINLLLFGILLYVIFQLGSKIVILSLGISLLLNFILIFRSQTSALKRKIWKVLLPSIIVFSVILIIVLPKTSFYKNIKIHAEFLGIESVTDILKPEMIDRFIFSDRLTFLKETSQSYLDSTLSEKFLGIGYIEHYGTDEVSTKLIEMDPFDLFYRHGIIGFIVYLLPLIWIGMKVLKKWYRSPKDDTEKLLFASLMLGIVMSFLTGHVISSPAVSIYLVILLLECNLYKEKGKR